MAWLVVRVARGPKTERDARRAFKRTCLTVMALVGGILASRAGGAQRTGKALGCRLAVKPKRWKRCTPRHAYASCGRRPRSGTTAAGKQEAVAGSPAVTGQPFGQAPPLLPK